MKPSEKIKKAYDNVINIHKQMYPIEDIAIMKSVECAIVNFLDEQQEEYEKKSEATTKCLEALHGLFTAADKKIEELEKRIENLEEGIMVLFSGKGENKITFKNGSTLQFSNCLKDAFKGNEPYIGDPIDKPYTIS